MTAIVKSQRVQKASKQEAEALTKKAALAWQTAARSRYSAVKLIITCLRRRVPEAMGMSALVWATKHLRDNGDKKITRLLKIARGLAELPDKTAEIMVGREGNAYEFARLPADIRSKPEWQKRAITEKVEVFHAAVQHRLKPSSGAKKEDPFLKFSVSLPGDVYDSMVEAEKHCAQALDFDMTDESKVAGFRIAIWERIAKLICDSAESDLREQLGGDKLPERSKNALEVRRLSLI